MFYDQLGVSNDSHWGQHTLVSNIFTATRLATPHRLTYASVGDTGPHTHTHTHTLTHIQIT